MARMNRTEKRKRKHLKVRKKIKGTSAKPRLCVFKSLKNIEAQLIDDSKNTTLVHSSSVRLKLKNGGNIKAAEIVGKDMGKKIKMIKKIKSIVFDRSGYIYHGRIKAFAEAVRKEGVKF